MAEIKYAWLGKKVSYKPYQLQKSQRTHQL